MSNRKKAVAYLRTSSTTNVGENKDSANRQRSAIRQYAKRNKIDLVAEFYDAGVSGTSPIEQRPEFGELLVWARTNTVDQILMESETRFARDLIIQLIGHDMLKEMGIDLVPVSAPDFFIDETPTAVMVRQILGAVSQFQKTELVLKLRAARERTGRLGGPERYAANVVRRAKRLAKKDLSLRKISAKLAEKGCLNARGKPYGAQSIRNMIA